MGKLTKSRARAAAAIVALCGTIAFFSNIKFINNASSQRHYDDQRLQSSIEAPLAASIEIPSLISPPASSLSNINSNSNRRQLSKALPNGGCEITWPKQPPPGIPITYAASYPGCGARMTWNLVEALTGLWTGDDWNNNGRGDTVVTVKTHYPQSNGILVDFDERILRGFIVIRNPMKSIPSFFNHIYEMRNHLPVHSERAPLEEWIKWREAYLDIEIAEYKKFICYWMDRYTPENRLLITYEGLTDDLIGAEVTKSLNAFLGQIEGVDPIDSESVPCIWKAVVKNEPPPQQAAQIKKLQSMAINQPQGAPPVKQQRQQRGQQSEMEMPQQKEQVQESMEQQPAASSSSFVDPRSTYGASEQQTQQQTPSLDQQLLEAKQQLAEAQQLMNQPQEQPEQLSVEQQLLATQQQLAEAQQKLGNDGRRLSEVEEVRGLRHSSQNHRRLDPGHHNSQRKGPQVPRPYTPQQLDKMMNMLLEVAERYQKEDVRLYHIMMGYYEKIREERAKLDGNDEFKVGTPPGGYF